MTQDGRRNRPTRLGFPLSSQTVWGGSPDPRRTPGPALLKSASSEEADEGVGCGPGVRPTNRQHWWGRHSAWLAVFALCTAAAAADKKPPQGHEEDASVGVTASIVSADQLRQEFGSEFKDYIVIDVRISPKDKSYQVHLDDFILRSESSGEHTGPFTAASQIAGAGALVVTEKYGNKANADSPKPLESVKIEMKDDVKGDPALDALKKRMLAEKSVSEPVSGLLFFPFSKEKPRHLILSYKTPSSHLRLSFH